ncbi:MAG TPA: DUF4192 domain-containing protein [Marmoricola sp.]|jgi:hypothetical protein|nr:DUF4192 domain-containing protein [Marmoricola sp.]
MDTFIAREPIDLLAVVPYVIGFHPEDSVVMLTFGVIGAQRPGGGESFHARVDLPVVLGDQRQLAETLLDVAVLHDAERVGLVLYTDDRAAAESFADQLLPGVIAAGIEVIDVLRVDGERFFSVGDDADPGTPYDLSTHPYTATQVLRGRVVHGSRTALRESLVGTDPDDIDAVSVAATDTVDRLLDAGTGRRPLSDVLRAEALWLQGRIERFLEDGAALSVPEAARLLVLVSFDALRDVAWAQMSQATAAAQVELWRGLLRRSPGDLRSGVAALLGFAAWLAGDGALAWCALERCGDPADSLAQQVAALVESAAPPSVWTPPSSASLRVLAPRGSAAS